MRIPAAQMPTMRPVNNDARCRKVRHGDVDIRRPIGYPIQHCLRQSVQMRRQGTLCWPKITIATRVIDAGILKEPST
jgi:hypothetical protein